MLKLLIMGCTLLVSTGSGATYTTSGGDLAVGASTVVTDLAPLTCGETSALSSGKSPISRALLAEVVETFARFEIYIGKPVTQPAEGREAEGLQQYYIDADVRNKAVELAALDGYTNEDAVLAGLLIMMNRVMDDPVFAQVPVPERARELGSELDWRYWAKYRQGQAEGRGTHSFGFRRERQTMHVFNSLLEYFGMKTLHLAATALQTYAFHNRLRLSQYPYPADVTFGGDNYRPKPAQK